MSNKPKTDLPGTQRWRDEGKEEVTVHWRKGHLPFGEATGLVQLSGYFVPGQPGGGGTRMRYQEKEFIFACKMDSDKSLAGYCEDRVPAQ
jgi:hypothetical protein